MKSELLASLNPPQQEAVTTLEGPLLILAGAGSGKTRVITYRIAYMLQKGIPQHAILALTFTNKAAREMQDRLKTLTQRKLSNLTVSTFHAFGVQILKKTIALLGYRDHFSIYDTADQVSLIKETARELKLNPETLEITKLLHLFSAIKTGRAEWNDANNGFRLLYQEYLSHLKAYNAVDFDDLIVLPIQIFHQFPEVREEFRNRFRYILVDEFQDTSMNQYDLMKLLADGSRNICVVGDDDQSIYSWRGANYRNIERFEQDYPERKEIKLEQNYRSTNTILAAANGVIAHNKNRKTKALWSGTNGGTPVAIHYPEDERAEGQFIATTIKSLLFKEKITYEDVGVLVRTNSLLRSLEEAFLAENIPYRISGGESFYQRKEIKDILSYLRLMANPDDDVSLLRIINTPRRGIGRRTLEFLSEGAKHRSCSLYSFITLLIHSQDSPLSGKMRQDLEDFVRLIETQRENALKPKGLASVLQSLVSEIDYWGFLVTEFQKNDKIAKWKYRNIELLIKSIEDWEQDPENLSPGLYTYLNRISLLTRDDIEDDREKGKVNLMTIHSAKGLEFQVVFLAGVEDGILPHARSLEENEENLEEERRLFYVALTRAREKLYITSCKKRRILRDVQDMIPSPFLLEIPQELLVVQEEEPNLSEERVRDAFASLKHRFTEIDDQGKKRVE
ncbi:MAG: UvrD-helicase domain-containing protein [Spirochaetales bacterium]|nr:UvrD-helicase domain-containing protein [Spirochaetales bacterium]